MIKAQCKETNQCPELLNHRRDKPDAVTATPMEVDSTISPSNKRRRISSNSEAHLSVTSTCSGSPESDVELTNGNTNDDRIKLFLTSKLSSCYRELVESSKLDVDGMVNPLYI